MATRQRYFSDEDRDNGVTPSRLKRLGKEKQLAYMRFWFFSNFEDPAQETPYNSEEGGYLFVWGGPYDAREQLSAEFGDFVPDDRIDQAAEEVEGEGISDWAPGRNHPDHKRAQEEYEAESAKDHARESAGQLEEISERLARGASPHFGDAAEIAERRRIVDRLAQLEKALQKTTSYGGIGHNNPPFDEDERLAELIAAGQVIREEL
jgi:hypothetical protein